MSNQQEQSTNLTDYSKDLLISDFEQTMEMLRHYDNFHWDLTKFCFSQIIVVIGACWYIHSDSKIVNLSVENLNLPIIPILLVFSALFTLLCILSLLRNRAYFCKVSHYINEQRNKAISNNDFGFSNDSEMWSDYQFPKLKDWFSTQFLSIYLLSLCMIFASFVASYILLPDNLALWGAIGVAIITIIIIVYLGSNVLKD